MDQYQWWADSMELGWPVKVEGTGTIPSEGLFNTVTHWDMSLTYQNGRVVKFVDQKTLYGKSIEPVQYFTTTISRFTGSALLVNGSMALPY